MKTQGPIETSWTKGHVPAANTQATCTKATPGAGKRNVIETLTVMLCAGATAPTAIVLTASLIDGATGGTTYLWQARIGLPAVAGASSGIVNIPCCFVGTPDTATTLEFSATGGANTYESVSMAGTVIG